MHTDLKTRTLRQCPAKLGQYRRSKWHRDAGTFALIEQLHGLLHGIAHPIGATPDGNVSLEVSPSHVHHDATALRQRPCGIISPSSDDGKERIGMIFQIMIIGAHRRVEFSAILKFPKQGPVLRVGVRVDPSVVQIAHGDVASRVVKFGIDLRRCHEHQLDADTDDKFYDQYEPSFHLVRRPIEFLVVPRLDARYAQRRALHTLRMAD
mmetsp:Transcript_21154/g.51079  ORF Transcript_21154/g.51079 Transcript_21154/m.51079 type:complete len:208 (-) Transcript_21154:996-1619(-)